MTMVVQVNGKVRDRSRSPPASAEEAEQLALASHRRWSRRSAGAAPRKVIARPPKLVNIVV